MIATNLQEHFLLAGRACSQHPQNRCALLQLQFPLLIFALLLQQAVLDTGVLRTIIELLRTKSHNVQVPALRCIANVTTGTPLDAAFLHFALQISIACRFFFIWLHSQQVMTRKRKK